LRRCFAGPSGIALIYQVHIASHKSTYLWLAIALTDSETTLQHKKAISHQRGWHFISQQHFCFQAKSKKRDILARGATFTVF
jgi:hypothetical protein